MHSRIRPLNSPAVKPGPVVYWMIRDQRAHDNWALLYAQKKALEHEQPLHVVFACRKDLSKHFGTTRMLDWMLKGLQEVEKELIKKNIHFAFLLGEPATEVLKYAAQIHASEVVLDFFPLKIYKKWQQQVAASSYLVSQVDTHNIVPCWKVSPKQEYAARTIRSKIHKLLPKYLNEIPPLKKMPKQLKHDFVDWSKIYSSIKVDTKIEPITWAKPGQKQAFLVLKTFITDRLDEYGEKRNDPSQFYLSNISPYLHFGQMSAQRVALEIKNAKANEAAKESYLEELIVRRELADNYCFYNDHYDSFAGFPNWAQQSLNQHRNDLREDIYSRKEFELARTHDPIWNAAQNELRLNGKMHGYLRMYWAKKILEWSASPEDAQQTAIYLNDMYSIDGRDPNGYVGIAWSIGGLHDRPWFEREIFGKVRYMSASGIERKFNIKAYVEKWNNTN